MSDAYILQDGKLFQAILVERSCAPGRITELIKRNAREQARAVYREQYRDLQHKLQEVSAQLERRRAELNATFPQWLDTIREGYAVSYFPTHGCWCILFNLDIMIRELVWGEYRWPVSWRVRKTAALPVNDQGRYDLTDLRALGVSDWLPHMSTNSSCIEIGEQLPNPIATMEDVRRIHNAILRAFSVVNAASPLVQLSHFPDLIRKLPVSIRRWARSNTRHRPPVENQTQPEADAEWDIRAEEHNRE